MKVGFHKAAGVLVVMGAGVFPPLTLSAALDPLGRILITSIAHRCELSCPWQDLRPLDGPDVPFADARAALTYLEAVFSLSPDGVVVTCMAPAAHALSAPRAVRKVSGRLEYASASNLDHRHTVLGVVEHASEANFEAQVITQGIVRNSGWSLTPNLPIYLGEDGVIIQSTSQTSLAFLLVLGSAIDPDTALIRIAQPIILKTIDDRS